MLLKVSVVITYAFGVKKSFFSPPYESGLLFTFSKEMQGEIFPSIIVEIFIDFQERCPAG
jgi:hypothetical protein